MCAHVCVCLRAFVRAFLPANASTHAALVRPKLVKLGFKFDNMVMEESAQILEVQVWMWVDGCGGVGGWVGVGGWM